jgi:LuxR family transcriptional regulator, maltose regulon positive regulatory protein
VPRTELMRSFARVRGGSVLLLQAPAGFGKTYALAQWARRAQRRSSQLGWLTVTWAEREYPEFSAALARTLAFVSLDELPPEPHARGSHLAQLIRSHGLRVCLVIDQLQLAETAANVTMLQSLLERVPDNLTVALATRTPTRIAVARVMLEGRLQRFDHSHLAFGPEETRALFGNSLTPMQLKSVHQLTQGWPAALRIAELCRPAWCARGGDLETLPMFLEQLEEYIAAEVLPTLEEPIAELLLACSVVDELSQPLAQAITLAPDCSERFNALVAAHGILRSSDANPQTYALPALLRLSLRRRLMKRDREYVRTLHARAAEWYKQSRHLHEAVQHYVACKDIDKAAEAIERAGAMTIALQEGDDRAAAILRLLPDSTVDTIPRLSLCRIFLDYKQGFFAQSLHRYEELSRLTSGFTRDRAGGDDEKLRLDAAFLDLVMQAYRRSHVSKEFLQSMEQRLAPGTHGDLQLVLAIHLVLGMLYRLRGDLELAASAFMEVEKMTAKLSSPWMMIWLRHHFGSLALARGRLNEARHELNTGLKRWRSHFHQERSYRALTYILLAEVDYETNVTAEAQAKIDEAMYSAEHVEGWYDVYASLYETAVRLCLQDAAPERAEMLLTRAEGIAPIRQLLVHFIPSMRAHIAMSVRDFKRAHEHLAKARLEQLWQDRTSTDQLSCRDWDLIGDILCRLAIEAGELDRAAGMLDRIYQLSRLSGRMRTQARVLLRLADVSRRRNERRRAAHHLAESLQIGKAQGYCRTFLDEPLLLRELIALTEATQELRLPDHLVHFAERLVEALPGVERPAETGPFSSREREVMHELALGHSNKLIARKLALSDATVKFHVQNIFRKLQVRKRASAVVEAHRRGLLA